MEETLCVPVNIVETDVKFARCQGTRGVFEVDGPKYMH